MFAHLYPDRDGMKRLIGSICYRELGNTQTREKRLDNDFEVRVARTLIGIQRGEANLRLLVPHVMIIVFHGTRGLSTPLSASCSVPYQFIGLRRISDGSLKRNASVVT